MSRAGRLALTAYGAAAFVYLVDRLSKLLAERNLADHAPIRLIPHVLDLTYTTNSGGAFGLFRGQPWLFFGASLVVVAAILVASSRLSSPTVAIGVGMILGGALGNLTDRVVHGTGVAGQVVDFIYLHNWPVFNVADSAIVVGTFLVVQAGFRGRPERQKAPRAGAGAEAPSAAGAHPAAERPEGGAPA